MQLESSQVLPSMLHRGSTVGEWLDDPRGAVVVKPVLDQAMARMGAGREEDSPTLGMDPMDMMRDLPLRVILRFAGDTLPAPPRQLIEGLLAQVHETGE